MEYTIDQQKVIRLHHRNLLVSAAAGSGKTAVLVERIVQMLLQKEHPVDIDRLLVVTFTKAAAAEMRERISIAIEKQLTEQPENEHLERQAALLHHAQITTIDSFCQSVLRNNFDRIGLDPGFRVADQNEIRLTGGQKTRCNRYFAARSLVYASIFTPSCASTAESGRSRGRCPLCTARGSGRRRRAARPTRPVQNRTYRQQRARTRPE